jgi:hypothetical protein
MQAEHGKMKTKLKAVGNETSQKLGQLKTLK